MHWYLSGPWNPSSDTVLQVPGVPVSAIAGFIHVLDAYKAEKNGHSFPLLGLSLTLLALELEGNCLLGTWEGTKINQEGCHRKLCHPNWQLPVLP